MMNIIRWIVDCIVYGEVIDLEFIKSDLEDIEFTEEEAVLHAEMDGWCEE